MLFRFQRPHDANLLDIALRDVYVNTNKVPTTELSLLGGVIFGKSFVSALQKLLISRVSYHARVSRVQMGYADKVFYARTNFNGVTEDGEMADLFVMVGYRTRYYSRGGRLTLMPWFFRLRPKVVTVLPLQAKRSTGGNWPPKIEHFLGKPNNSPSWREWRYMNQTPYPFDIMLYNSKSRGPVRQMDNLGGLGTHSWYVAAHENTVVNEQNWRNGSSTSNPGAPWRCEQSSSSIKVPWTSTLGQLLVDFFELKSGVSTGFSGVLGESDPRDELAHYLWKAYDKETTGALGLKPVPRWANDCYGAKSASMTTVFFWGLLTGWKEVFLRSSMSSWMHRRFTRSMRDVHVENRTNDDEPKSGSFYIMVTVDVDCPSLFQELLSKIYASRDKPTSG